MSADLHLHTRLSNGSLGIEDIILLAKKRGVTTIAITDHDCLAGTVRGKVIGERHGITVIPGVELSGTDKTNGQEFARIGTVGKHTHSEFAESVCYRNGRSGDTHSLLVDKALSDHIC